MHLDIDATHLEVGPSGPVCVVASCYYHHKISFFPTPKVLSLFTGQLDSKSYAFNGMGVIMVTLANKKAMISKPHTLYHKIR